MPSLTMKHTLSRILENTISKYPENLSSQGLGSLLHWPLPLEVSGVQGCAFRAEGLDWWNLTRGDLTRGDLTRGGAHWWGL